MRPRSPPAAAMPRPAGSGGGGGGVALYTTFYYADLAVDPSTGELLAQVINSGPIDASGGSTCRRVSAAAVTTSKCLAITALPTPPHSPATAAPVPAPPASVATVATYRCTPNWAMSATPWQSRQVAVTALTTEAMPMRNPGVRHQYHQQRRHYRDRRQRHGSRGYRWRWCGRGTNRSWIRPAIRAPSRSTVVPAMSRQTMVATDLRGSAGSVRRGTANSPPYGVSVVTAVTDYGGVSPP